MISIGKHFDLEEGVCEPPKKIDSIFIDYRPQNHYNNNQSAYNNSANDKKSSFNNNNNERTWDNNRDEKRKRYKRPTKTNHDNSNYGE